MNIRVAGIISIFLLSNCTYIQAQENRPLSCNISGKIVSILKDREKDKTSPCSKYPCRAMVRILSVNNCGSSITAPPNIGDTIEVYFSYTLHKTKKIFPALPARYPGMKKGSVFAALVEQHNIIGSTTEFVVNDYSVKKDSN